MSASELKIVSKEEAVSIVKSGDRLFFQGAAMTPTTLINALCDRHHELKDVEIVQMHTEGEAKYMQEPCNNAFKLSAFFVGKNVRDGVNNRNGSYIPIFLSEIHWLFRRGLMPLDVAFIQVSPPDKHGFCSLGVSVDVTLPAIQTAKKVIAQVNPQVPRTHGDGIIHVSSIDMAVEIDQPIFQAHLGAPTDNDLKIGTYISDLIDDGSTLQMGIGNIPNVVLNNLGNHKNLGIHTEMFSDGVLPLVKNGVINGSKKVIENGKMVTCFAVGSQELYDFIDDNPQVTFKEAAYTNDTAIIRQNPKVVAINSAIEIDLTGQVCADTIGTYHYSGVGGQMDFIRGASLSEGGKAIFGLPSITAKGHSKIVPTLKGGAGVTTTRAHVHYVVTENGVVNLFGKSLKERAKLMISIAHPSQQEALAAAAFERFGYVE
jgi:acyl-CoA hydrolase